MWRFYAIAAVIVLAVGSMVFARRAATLRDFTVEGSPRPGQTPTVTRAAPASAATAAQTFRGEGSWAMSALPDCFDELRSVVGPFDLVRARIPPAADRLPAGAQVRWDGCTLRVGDDDIVIARGPDRLRIPPHAALYRRGDRLVLVWRNATGRTEIRTYAAR